MQKPTEEEFIAHLKTFEPLAVEELQERIRDDIKKLSNAEPPRSFYRYEPRPKRSFLRGVMAGTCIGLALGIVLAGLGLRYFFPAPTSIEIVYLPIETGPHAAVAEFTPPQTPEKPEQERTQSTFAPYDGEVSTELDKVMAAYRLRTRLSEAAGSSIGFAQHTHINERFPPILPEENILFPRRNSTY